MKSLFCFLVNDLAVNCTTVRFHQLHIDLVHTKYLNSEEFINKVNQRRMQHQSPTVIRILEQPKP